MEKYKGKCQGERGKLQGASATSKSDGARGKGHGAGGRGKLHGQGASERSSCKVKCAKERFNG